MTRYMLDTTILSDLIRNPQGRAARRIAKAGENSVCTSIIVAAELRYGCAKSGFGVFSAGKYYEFDEAGNGMAKMALEKSAAEKGAMFKVMGKVADNKMMVTKITEVVAKAKKS